MATGKDEGRGEEEEELIMVGDGVEDEESGEQARGADDDGEGEGKGEGEGDDGDDDDDLERHADDDARTGHGEPEDDEVRERRRLERKTRRQRQKEARDRDQRELNFLRKRNEQVERNLVALAKRVDASEATTVDGRINQIDAAIRNAEDVYAKAISAGEGDDAAEAQRIRDGLRDKRNQLVQYKESRKSGAEETGGESGPDPAVVERVREWHGRNSWFRFDRADEDSAIVGAIDDNLVREGYDPTTPEYYDELDRRIATRLPHHASGAGAGGAGTDGAGDGGDGGDGGDRGKGNGKGGGKKPAGPRFRVGGRERPLKSNEVHISRERKEAMIEAGVWEDPVLRKKFLRRYADYDKQHAND